MILCEFCAWESFQLKEYEDASKVWTTCCGCGKIKKCGWWSNK